MKNLRLTGTFIVLCVSAFTISDKSFAADTIALCNDCSEQQMETKAVQHAPNGGKVHVIDVIGNQVRAYETKREQGLVMYWSAPVKQSIKEGVQHIRNAKNTIEDLARGHVNLEQLRPYLGAYSDIQTAHTVAKSANQKAAISRALTDYFTGNIAGALTSASVSLGTAIVNQALTVNLAINVYFPNDGTTYSFVFKGAIKNVNGEVSLWFEPINHSGRDKGVPLSESSSYADYQANGPDDALQRIIDHMIASGVDVYVGGTPHRGGRVTVTSIRCSNERPKGCKAVR
ncbi:hypothetical protein [Pseudoalteromonas sp. S16_S37]|uniref:hypothetical protein n=1 Tax=Pseudoalteromonas sp. S16_S37 TaxID=2720228 RepID=UPI00168133DB|nr:hypothetical protein [Pseudoalteromonas sp. S16_S37]MBD1581559.1 hypothetical protein [Pseudoalteromonas sp. S16_S37]